MIPSRVPQSNSAENFQLLLHCSVILLLEKKDMKRARPKRSRRNVGYERCKLEPFTEDVIPELRAASQSNWKIVLLFRVWGMKF